MRPLTLRLLAVLTALALLGESHARADQVNFSYYWTAFPEPVVPGTFGNVLVKLPAIDSGSAVADSTELNATPGKGHVVGEFTPNPVAGPDPDVFNSSYKLIMHLTDTKSGQ